MIEIERTDPRLRRLLDEERIPTVMIRGELDLACEKSRRIFLDDPDYPSGVLVIGDWVKIHARYPEALEHLLPALEGMNEISVSAVNPWIRDRLAQEWALSWETRCWLWYLESSELVIPSPLHSPQPLRPEHAALVNRHWEHGDENSVEYVRWRIREGPSFAVFQEGEPVSWCLVHGDEAMGPAFTLPQARHKGYATSITVALVQDLLGRGRIPYLNTLQENMAPQRLADRLGFRRWGDVCWLGAKRIESSDRSKQED
ncbi:MAG: GNAT family N-acetyltransferase [bacterium]